MHIRELHPGESPPHDLLLTADPSPCMIKDYLDRGMCFIAEESGIVLGVFVLLPTRPHTIELINIAVIENERGKGIGKTLVLKAIEIATLQKYKRIEVGTGNSSLNQLALYQKCGFRISEIEKDFFTTYYSQKIIENDIHCQDMIRLTKDL